MAASVAMEEFEALLNESFELETPDEGSVVKGTVVAIEAGQAIIDIGYKMEGRIDIKEFAAPGQNPEIAIGDVVEVYLDRVENARGEAVLSREKPVVKKLGTALKKPMKKKSAAKALSLAGLKVVSPWILAALLRSCRAARLTCAPCAMPAR